MRVPVCMCVCVYFVYKSMYMDICDMCVYMLIHATLFVHLHILVKIKKSNYFIYSVSNVSFILNKYIYIYIHSTFIMSIYKFLEIFFLNKFDLSRLSNFVFYIKRL